MVLHPTSTQPLRGCPVAVLDFESTGTDPQTCHPVQVAVATIDALGDSEPTLALSTLIRPPVSIPPESTEVHGITDRDVASAPTLDDVLPDLLAAIEGRALAAYNLPFDWTILRRAIESSPIARKLGAVSPLPWGCIDPLVMAKEIDKYERGKKLVQVAGRRGLALPNAHDAGADVLMTARLLPVLLRELGRGRDGRGPWCRGRDLQSIAAFWRWTVQTARAQERDLDAHLRRTTGHGIDRFHWQEAA